jgi:hypothetical protein
LPPKQGFENRGGTRSKPTDFKSELGEAQRVSARILKAQKVRQISVLRDGHQDKALRLEKPQVELEMVSDPMDFEWETPVEPDPIEINLDDDHVDWEKLMDALGIHPRDRMVWLSSAKYEAMWTLPLTIEKPLGGLQSSQWAKKW